MIFSCLTELPLHSPQVDRDTHSGRDSDNGSDNESGNVNEVIVVVVAIAVPDGRRCYIIYIFTKIASSTILINVAGPPWSVSDGAHRLNCSQLRSSAKGEAPKVQNI